MSIDMCANIDICVNKDICANIRTNNDYYYSLLRLIPMFALLSGYKCFYSTTFSVNICLQLEKQ